MTCRVHWQATGQSFTVESDKSLLFSLLERGLELEFDCMYGHCRRCLARLVSGRVRHQTVPGLSGDERQAAYILLCAAYPESEYLSLSP